MTKKNNFPFEGEIFYPSKQKFKEIVIFTHHYGGSKKNLLRHIQLINDLGLRAFAFNLFPQPFSGSFHFLKNPAFYFQTLESVWKKQIFQALAPLREEQKILFSFSFSCNVISQIYCKIPQVKAIIFDGGPFASIFKNSWFYLSQQEKISNFWLRCFIVPLWSFFFGFFFLKFKIKYSLKKMEKAQLPLLSFQAEEDPLVPPECINSLLRSYKKLNLTVCGLKKTSHLKGLKTQPEVYKKTLKNFLDQNFL